MVLISTTKQPPDSHSNRRPLSNLDQRLGLSVLGEKEAFFQVLPMSFDLACDALQYRKAPSTKHQSRFVVVILEFTVVASARGSGASLVLWLSL